MMTAVMERSLVVLSLGKIDSVGNWTRVMSPPLHGGVVGEEVGWKI